MEEKEKITHWVLRDYASNDLTTKPIFAEEAMASLAVHLLKGDDYEDAVRKAYGLLIECQRVNLLLKTYNDYIVPHNAPLLKKAEKARALPKDETDKWPYRKRWEHGLTVRYIDAVRVLAGQPRPERAKAAFLKKLERMDVSGEERNDGWNPAERTEWDKVFDKFKDDLYDPKKAQSSEPNSLSLSLLAEVLVRKKVELDKGRWFSGESLLFADLVRVSLLMFHGVLSLWVGKRLFLPSHGEGRDRCIEPGWVDAFARFRGLVVKPDLFPDGISIEALRAFLAKNDELLRKLLASKESP